jgi:hypothetical protein
MARRGGWTVRWRSSTNNRQKQDRSLTEELLRVIM